MRLTGRSLVIAMCLGQVGNLLPVCTENLIPR